MDFSKITNEEILEIALKIERDGGIYYNELADKIKDLKIKDFLLFMAKEEQTKKTNNKNNISA